MTIDKRTCIDCKHWIFTAGEPDYSDLTPGYDAEMYCVKGVWRADNMDETTQSLRIKLKTAENCELFVAVEYSQ